VTTGDGTTAPAAGKPTATRSRAHAARSRGRVLAVQMLYAFEQNHYLDDGVLVPEDILADCDEGAQSFARDIFQGFCAQRPAVDAAVDTRLDNWSISRLAVLDRSLLRLGSYELLYCADTPPKVAINEYIELAKQFGSEAKTTKLVNGVLDRIAREHRGGEVGPRAPT